MARGHASDAMIRRLEQELEERDTHAQGIIRSAQDDERDLNDAEKATLVQLRSRMAELQEQLEQVESTVLLATQTSERLQQIDSAITTGRRQTNNPVEYRTAGAYALDAYQAHIGDRQARERIEVFSRVAAHQTTGDNLGVIPDPVLGGVIDFIDASRPLVSVIGPQPMPSATWHRPIITQRPSVAVQGSAGAEADEKTELVSQKMLITRLTANAVTYGGYVNVSRQNIDFSSPQIMDLIINGLAQQYAIETEKAVGVELTASSTAAVGYLATATAASVAGAIWAAAGDIYTTTRGMGRLILAVAPDRLEVFGPLFPPINVQNGQSLGLSAADYRSGVVGSISGVTLVMSAGLESGQAFLFSTSAIEVFEQRVGTLQVTEPSVLGVQVAYAGYFTPLTIDDGGIVELTAS